MEKKLWWNNRKTMKLPSITIKQLLEAGVHLGHKTFRWNPKMNKFIFGAKNSIHIIDLVQTLEMINRALPEIHKCITSGGKILFVSTKNENITFLLVCTHNDDCVNSILTTIIFVYSQ